MSRTRLVRAASACLLVAAAACGDDNGNAPPPPGSFTLTLATTVASVQAGATTTDVATIARTEPFAGAVALTTESTTGGITGSFDPASIPAGATTSTLTVTVADTVAPGDYPVTVRAAATGLTDQTVTLTLTVTAPPASPDFSLTVAPAALSITQGANDSTLATVVRSGGFADTVTLAVSGLPDSVSATIGTPSLGADTTTIVFAVGETAAPGTYSAIVSGTGTGVTAHADTIDLTIAQGASYSLSLDPDSISVLQGQAGQALITLARDSGFTADVALTVDSLPNGVVATPAQPSLDADTTSLAISVDSTVAPGTYAIVVRGNSAGRAETVDSLQLTVVANVTSGIAVELAADSVTIEAGRDSTLAVIITRTAFTDSVHLAVTGAPTGTTVSTTSTTGDTATVTVSVSDSTVPGAYILVVTASGTSVADAATQLYLTVAPKPSSIGQSQCSGCGTRIMAPPASSRAARQSRSAPARATSLAVASRDRARPALTPGTVVKHR
jgi:hypothetical protein